MDTLLGQPFRQGFLVTQFFVTKMHTKKEGWMAKKCLDSAHWNLLALVCKDWVLTCLVKMDDDRTEASGQLRAAAL